MHFGRLFQRYFRLLIFTITGFIVFSCEKTNRKNAEEDVEIAANRKNLAQKYCGSCHLPVDPALLDKETWRERVLPAMAKKLGMEVFQNHQYFQNKQSAISYGDWMEIVAFYDSLAPDKLVQSKVTVIPTTDLLYFEVKKPARNPDFIATTTLVSIDVKTNQISTSSAENADFQKWSSELKRINSTILPSPAVHLLSDSGRADIITCIGDMKAIDVKSGEILKLNPGTKSKPEIMAKNLIRPIHTQVADFNADGLSDYVVCSFGHEQGGLYWLKQQPDKTFQTIPIREVAGATQAVTGDFNQDGWPDIVALFAHGDEGIWLFTNNQKGGFSEKNLLRFPPVYGSSSFQLGDINQDGKADIIYTAGDNSDYSRILKPYHGLYIFTNTGADKRLDKFQQTYFYPINGATKALAADFDLDGDIDIASIAFFADLAGNPAETFMYFEQAGKQNKISAFKPYTVPVHKLGRWICMDVNDLDGDGDPDIVLGNYAKGFLNQENFKPDWNLNLPFIVLTNKTK
jgi:hypothetical protein